MTGVDVLAVLKECGVVLQPQGDVLHYRAPKGVLTAVLRQALVDNKPEVLALLNTTEQLPLHRRHKTRAGGVATTKDPRQSPHWSENHRSSEEQRAASQGARPVHQMPARTRQAKQGPL